MLPFVQQRKGNVMDLEALIARLEGTDGVFGVNGGDAVCKEAAALLRMQADIITSRDEHRLVLTSYEATNLREALRAVARGNSPLRALHTGDWLGSIVLMLEQKKIDREPNRRWEDICKRANEREDRPGSDDFYVCPFCDCNSNAHSPRCCDKAAAMKPSDYHQLIGKLAGVRAAPESTRCRAHGGGPSGSRCKNTAGHRGPHSWHANGLNPKLLTDDARYPEKDE